MYLVTSTQFPRSMTTLPNAVYFLRYVLNWQGKAAVIHIDTVRTARSK